MNEDALFCVDQKAFIEKDDKVLILKTPEGELDFPGGKIQQGEARVGAMSSLTRSLQREVMEETGLVIDVFNPFAVWYYEFLNRERNAGKVVYLVAFKCKYVAGDVKLSNEHGKFRWVSRDDYHDVDDGSEYFDVLKKYFGAVS